tara:strand:- start:627 stop:770 length:144 start_codon:yes stop_codon:yes gene_type:complete
MLHFILSAFFIYIVSLLLFPQQVAAVTLLLVGSLMTAVDWSSFPWQP